jgi:hypothetical protein
MTGTFSMRTSGDRHSYVATVMLKEQATDKATVLARAEMDKLDPNPE